MLLNTPENKKIVDDYDIIFSSGLSMPLTIDLTRGDSISFEDKAILIHLASKPSQGDPKRFLPAEDITVFTPHIISIQHRAREVIELSPNEQEAYKKTWQELTAHPTIQ